MYVYGSNHIHAAHSVSAPHRPASTQAAGPAYRATGVDQLDISPEADLIHQVHSLPDIRADRVAEIRAQIASGAYETPEKLDLALERLLDEIA
jgi:negative regulator of flagellin synthesis FlgM